MTIAEKIKFYRTTRKLTQKRLAELSGVSEISICKYEAGDRKPKPAQINKLANALKIGANRLMDINIDKIELRTVGDFMSMFYAMDEQLGTHFTFTQLEDGHIDPDSVGIHIQNPVIKEYLVRLAEAQLSGSPEAYLSRDMTDPDEIAKEHETAQMVNFALYEAMKKDFCASTELLLDDE